MTNPKDPSRTPQSGAISEQSEVRTMFAKKGVKVKVRVPFRQTFQAS